MLQRPNTVGLDATSPKEFAKRQELYAKICNKQNLNNKRLKEKDQKFVHYFPTYLHKSKSTQHAKFLLGKKVGGQNKTSQYMN